jgi:uncharacterized protein (TIGR03790 family)
MITTLGPRNVTTGRGIRPRTLNVWQFVRIQRSLAAAFALVLGAAGLAHAQSAENVAVVINTASADSRRIGEYYVQKRGIPATNIIRIRTAVEEQVEVGVFVQEIERPISDVLTRENLQDRILYLVLTKGVPLLITGTGGRQGTRASVDSELTLLYRRFTGRSVVTAGPAPNPYFLGVSAIREAQPFTHRRYDLFLVARLDGFTVEDVIALVDRAQSPAQEGRIVLDQRGGFSGGTGDAWLAQAARRLQDLGQSARVVLEDTERPARNVDNVIGYYSWGSNDAQNRVRRFGMQFVPGALASLFVSTDGRTFTPPAAAWVPSEDQDPKTWHAGSPQSLAGDLIREGVTGVAANVAEPFLDGSIRPEILFPAYLAGFNLIEAFYLALPTVSWQTVVIGDPLCAPFRNSVLSRAAIEEPLDPATELPALFSKWRTDVARQTLKGVPPEAVSLILKAQSRLTRADRVGARAAFEEATKIAPQATGAQLQLAELYDAAGEWNKAVERYRQVLKHQPDNLPALNNLAHALTSKQNLPADGLPFARRAATLAPNNPAIVDTLAWIEHLLGNSKEAAVRLRPLVQQSTGLSEVHLHAAIIFASAGEPLAAEEQLAEALRLDPKLANRPEVKALQSQLRKE